MKEWRILEKHLPDSIFVRVYEERVDLLRAVIIGPKGTPYHDGLFFFDIQVPSDYPASPPNVYYRSFGYSINPNLYAWGNVCLSLLNTWNGQKYQRWNPFQSTILQVLVSIQGLVLNAEPYYNEPGYGNISPRPSWFKKRSLRYNEDVFIMSCKTMLSILKRPPKSFEEFVNQYFRNRASAILVACHAYINGQAEIGGPIITSTAETKITTSLTSFTFKAAAGFLYPRLVDSFIKNGSSVESIELLDTSKIMRKSIGRRHTIYPRSAVMLLVLIIFAMFFVQKFYGAGVLLYSLFGFYILLLFTCIYFFLPLYM
ncbi:putative ubiquitin-conjugating enzyme E2 38 [Papaver somniferum]|uniref:putative ubiquitin-conjugating enzyme E2 38 n=1 Tax=Papaver somniferum TaxID=3469 RepID=UPI000E6F7A8D|nr:putative ubiquitin-conjugating enzyme E2 38 [Papaver somniferum]